MSVAGKVQTIPQEKSYEKSKNKFLESIEFYMRLAATKPNSVYKDVPLVFFGVFVTSFCAVTGWVMFFYKYDDLSVNTDVLLHAVIVSHTLYVYLVYLKNRYVLSNMTESMRGRFESLSKQLQLHKYHQAWDRADKISLAIMRFANFFVGSIYAFYIYNAGIFSSNRKLLFPLWTPYSLETDIYYYLTVFAQVTFFAYNHFIHLPGLGLCIGGAHFIGASFDVLGLTFSDICDLDIHLLNDKKKYKNEITFFKQANANRKLKWIIETHFDILRFVKDYKTVFETILIEVMLSYEVVICFAAFQAVLAAETRDYQKMAQDCFMVMVIVFHLFTFCYPGQHVYNKSEMFRHSLYCSHWEDQSLSFRKSVTIMLAATTRPISITFRGIVNASMMSFQHALRTAFSYVNILMVLKEHH